MVPKSMPRNLGVSEPPGQPRRFRVVPWRTNFLEATRRRASGPGSFHVVQPRPDVLKPHRDLDRAPCRQGGYRLRLLRVTGSLDAPRKRLDLVGGALEGGVLRRCTTTSGSGAYEAGRAF